MERFLFAAGVALVAIVIALLLFRQWGYGLEYDESYLLSVVRNLAEGHGWIDDGVTFYGGQRPFEPTISTGPTVLLPAAWVWAATGGSLLALRILMTAYFALLVTALALLFARWGGRWTALASVAAILVVPVVQPDLQNGSLMPGRVVGELPALAFMVLATLLASRRRPLLAGLCLGLALTAKMTFILAVGVLGLAWLLLHWRRERTFAIRSTVALAIGAVVPVAAFELYKFITLGLDGYLDAAAEARHFAALQNPSLSGMPLEIALKSSSTALVLPLALIPLIGIALLTRWRLGRLDPSGALWKDEARFPPHAAIVATTWGMSAMFAWWLLRSVQTSPRPGLPTVLWLLACLGAFTADRIVRLRRDARPGDSWARGLTITACAVAALALSCQAVVLARDTSGAQLLADQKAAAVILAEHGKVPTDGYWTNPEFRILTDLPADTSEGQTLAVFTSIRALNMRHVADAREYLYRCISPLLRTRNVLVCDGVRPAPD
jgi:4-amino-4-deoxy-L-arabinose transferase-like glycosyltransferase